MQDISNTNAVQENRNVKSVLEKFLKPLKYYYDLRDNEIFFFF